MSSHDFDLGILGGGSAGLTVAAGAAQLGAKTLLIEKEPQLGGDCLHFGCVPSKTLIKTAAVYHHMKTGPKYGLPGLEPPPVDFRLVRERIKAVIARIQEHDSAERFCSLGARVETGEGRFLDGHTVETPKGRFSAARWVIATGSSPSLPPVPGLKEAGCLTNRDIFQLDELPSSLIILGGGPIAVEMAQAFGRLGAKVSLVQRGPRILSKEDPDLALVVEKALAAEGVEVYTNTSLMRVDRKGPERELVFTDAQGGEVVLRAAQILAALGRRANLGELDLAAAGVETDKKGLVLDQRLRTSRTHIFGAGDVTGENQFTHAAGYEGGVVLANAVFRLPRKVDYTFLPHATFSDPQIAGLGLNESQAKRAGVQYTVWKEEFRSNDRALAEGYDQGFLKLLLDRKENILGVQIVGPQAGELINEWAAVLAGKVRLSSLASAVHPYPTLGEINKRVAGDVLAPKLFSGTVKKGLKFFFNLRGRASCAMGEK